jgi:hypothetical protein
MNQTFKFSILRFSYDPLTEEFVNVGVVMYSPQARYLSARVTSSYARASRFYVRIDGTRFRQLTKFVEDRIRLMGDHLSNDLEFERPLELGALLTKILPSDDSAFRFGEIRGGISDDLEATLLGLFDRYVDTYNRGSDGERRTEDEVWRTFRLQLDKRLVTPQLQPKKIVSTNYEYHFEHAWKNGLWNLYEPISFDLLDGSAMLEKANKWVGRAFALSASTEPFRLTFLLGAPTSPHLQEAYVRAENLLNGIKVKHQFIREDEAAAFAKKLEEELKVPHEN